MRTSPIWMCSPVMTSGRFVLAVGVKAGHLGGFAADEGAAIGAACFRESADDGFYCVRVLLAQLAGGEVVEEEQGRGTLYGDVVDAVIDEVGADGVVDAEFEGDLELGTNAVCARDQHRLREFFEIEREEAAEAADLGEHVLVECFAREHFDALLGAVAGRDVDACRGIGGGSFRTGWFCG
jgi:hypothetical protein